MTPTTRRYPRKVNDDVVRDMHAAGSTTNEIAGVLGVHKSTIHTAFKRLGLTSHFFRAITPGDRYGRYTILAEADRRVKPNGVSTRMALAKCDCGTEKVVRFDSLYTGKIVSCGCFHREISKATLSRSAITHGQSRTSLHRIWSAMKARCTKPANKRWGNYGGRGIKVCDEWMRSYESFAAHVGPKPDGKSLDRINNDGNYEPGNVRWATYTEQANNRRPRRVQR